MTGIEIDLIYQQQIGQTYSGIEDPIKRNRRFRKALINAIEGKYRALNEEREFDELRSVIKTEVEFVFPDLDLNMLPMFQNNIAHVLSIKATYRDSIDGQIIKTFTQTTPVVMELFTYSSIRDKEKLVITNAYGILPTPSVDVYVKAKNRFKFELYADPYFPDNPIAPLGAFAPSQAQPVKIERVKSNYCQMIRSDEKISSVSSATKDYPRYEIQEGSGAFGSIKIYPYDQVTAVCEKVTVDYIRSDIEYIDITSQTDYSQFYSEKFQYHVIDLACKDFDLSFKDYNSAQAQEQQIIINP